MTSGEMAGRLHEKKAYRGVFEEVEPSMVSMDECVAEPDATESDRVFRRRSSGAHLGEAESGLKGTKSSIPDFDIYPEYLREGPWSPAAVVYLTCFGGWLVWSAREAFFGEASAGAHLAESASWETRLLLGAIAGYLVVVHVHAFRQFGSWPYVSYTMVGYTILTLRFAAVALGLSAVAEFLRFPMLVMAWTTTTIWWTLIFPVMTLCMPGGSEARWKFLKFNFGFFLLNVHLFNLPLAMLDHYLTWRPLVLWDLWVGMAVAFLYVMFYLFVLDKNGMHFYIILSPRRAWCCIPGYTSVLAVYLGIYFLLG